MMKMKTMKDKMKSLLIILLIKEYPKKFFLLPVESILASRSSMLQQLELVVLHGLPQEFAMHHFTFK
jgi:hypothetical protein